MSAKGQQQQSSEAEGRPSGIKSRTFVISRSENQPRSGRNSMYSSRSSYSGGRASLTPGVYQQLSNSGVTDFKGTRQKEKKDLQGLNERFASYIEQVHFLDAKCRKLEAENEALRNRKGEDFAPIRAAYENELAQARKVIDDLGSTKGVAEGKVAGLQDEIDQLRGLIATYENQGKDYQKKIEANNNTIGEYEGELTTLRLRINALEDENAKVREILEKVQDTNRRLRSDLDSETAAHIEADCLAQTKTEECEFLKDLLDQLEAMKPEPITIKGMDYSEFWKSELARCLRDINGVYDEKLDLIQADCEAKFASQINSLNSSQKKDAMQLSQAKEENKRLRDQLADRNALISELQSKCNSLQTQVEQLTRELAEAERRYDEMERRKDEEINRLNDELEGVMAELKALSDAKISLELEIGCYKKLLEGEESRVGLRSLVEDTLGVKSKGGNKLADVIQQSS